MTAFLEGRGLRFVFQDNRYHISILSQMGLFDQVYSAVCTAALPSSLKSSSAAGSSESKGSSASKIKPQHMARLKLLLLTYDAEAAATCTGMVCPVAGPVPHHGKEPVGHIFHYKVMLQQGLIGECFIMGVLLVVLAVQDRPSHACKRPT